MRIGILTNSSARPNENSTGYGRFRAAKSHCIHQFNRLIYWSTHLPVNETRNWIWTSPVALTKTWSGITHSQLLPLWV